MSTLGRQTSNSEQLAHTANDTCYSVGMSINCAPATLRLDVAAPEQRAAAAITVVKQMSVEKLRTELRARRDSTPAAREQIQRDVVTRRAADAAARLRTL